ncbi:hypothetical protein AB0I69_25615 [Streptomyces sp. NPDC050508]|uniref:hypothetical protein n=1 Tax=Streptomyces sp. NPDC050508 TaxID=3155405 RepID=UPI00341BF193
MTDDLFLVGKPAERIPSGRYVLFDFDGPFRRLCLDATSAGLVQLLKGHVTAQRAQELLQSDT